MARFECTPPGCIGFGFIFAWWAAADALLPEPNQLYRVAFFSEHCMGFSGMVGCPFGFVVTSEPLAAICDTHRRFGAAFTSERFFNTALPVDSDLIRTIGSSSLPTRVTVPPLGALIVARLPPILVMTP